MRCESPTTAGGPAITSRWSAVSARIIGPVKSDMSTKLIESLSIAFVRDRSPDRRAGDPIGRIRGRRCCSQATSVVARSVRSATRTAVGPRPGRIRADVARHYVRNGRGRPGADRRSDGPDRRGASTLATTEGRGSRGRFEAYGPRPGGPGGAEAGRRPSRGGRPGIGRSAGSTASCTGSSRGIGRRSRWPWRRSRSATTLRLVPPAATKLVIDYVLLGQAAAAGPPGLAADPADAPGPALRAGRRRCWSSRSLGTAIGLWGRWLATRASKRLQVDDPPAGLRARRAAAAAPGLPAQGRRGGEPAPRGRRRASASWSSA